MSDVPRIAVFFCYRERLHHVPRGKVRAPDVTDLAPPDEIIERSHDLFDGRERIEAVKLVNVDEIGAEAAEAGVDSFDQVVARGAEVIGPGAHAKRSLGRDDHLVATALDGLAENFFSHAI